MHLSRYACVTLLAALMGGIGCGTRGQAGFAAGKTGEWPSAPASMHIYPLTHIEYGGSPPAQPVNPGGPSPMDNVPPQPEKRPEPRVITHLDFRDAWGDTTKAIGTVTIFLYGPSGRGLPEGEEAATQQRRYDIDLRDLKRNAELFDPATRTYRIPLSGLPAWIGTASDPARLTLRAEMTCVRPDGTSNLLVDEYLVTK